MSIVRMKLHATLFALTAFACLSAFAQEPVVGVADPEKLFTDKDPKLHADKQVAYHIMFDLLEHNQWSQAEKWLTKEYHQHNPLAATGLDGVLKFFSSRTPTPATGKMQT